MNSTEKGRILEQAIKQIEHLILTEVSAIDPNKIKIFTNYKNIPGYEIDILVDVEDKMGYNSRFIFEAKNWKSKKVERKDITDFAEKIDKSSAQRGFYIAKYFTTGAISRIKEDGRIVKVNFDNVPNLPLIFWTCKILDENNTYIKLLKTDKYEFNNKMSINLTLNGERKDELSLISDVLVIVNTGKEILESLKLIISKNNLVINDSPIDNLTNFDIVTKYHKLDMRLDVSEIFGVKDRGTHFTLWYSLNGVNIFKFDSTSIKKGKQILNKFKLLNVSGKQLYGVEMKLEDNDS